MESGGIPTETKTTRKNGRTQKHRELEATDSRSKSGKNSPDSGKFTVLGNIEEGGIRAVEQDVSRAVEQMGQTRQAQQKTHGGQPSPQRDKQLRPNGPKFQMSRPLAQTHARSTNYSTCQTTRTHKAYAL